MDKGRALSKEERAQSTTTRRRNSRSRGRRTHTRTHKKARTRAHAYHTSTLNYRAQKCACFTHISAKVFKYCKNMR